MKKKHLICLGCEATAHTFGIGIVNQDCEILANVKDTFTTEQGGLIPREVADHHFQVAFVIVQKALEKSGVQPNQIDVVSFSQGPGLGPCLKVGALAARTLALTWNKPLLGVNHPVSHIEIGKALTDCQDPIVVYASGANTQIIGYQNGRYRVFGETLDTGIGNVLDSFGRSIGIGFPAGPTLDQWYFEKHDYLELPYSVKGMDLVFSGLLTAAQQKVKTFPKKDVSFSLLHTAFAMLTEVTERALAHTEKKEVLLVGGVAASKGLQKMMLEMCEKRNAKLFVPPSDVCTDQGAMIAWQGLIEFRSGRKQKLEDSRVNPLYRADQVEVSWIKNKKTG
ncbi:MAG: bifunctional N(6)-L-threonylcarbamoyladenine synthase/serine/threonine protein kinase [Candidatus Micrarchaeota archaeon]